MVSHHATASDNTPTDNTPPVADPGTPIAAMPSTPSIPDTLAIMDARLKRIEDKIVPHHDNKNANRVILAGAFAFAGWHTAAILFGKIGLIVDLVRAYRRDGIQAVKEMAYSFLTLFQGKKMEEAFHTYKFSTYGVGIGTAVGLIGGAWLGLARGDRLDDAGDLVTHPIESLNKILGPAPKKTAENLDALPENPANAPALQTQAERAHLGTIIAPEKSLSA